MALCIIAFDFVVCRSVAKLRSADARVLAGISCLALLVSWAVTCSCYDCSSFEQHESVRAYALNPKLYGLQKFVSVLNELPGKVWKLGKLESSFMPPTCVTSGFGVPLNFKGYYRVL